MASSLVVPRAHPFTWAAAEAAFSQYWDRNRTTLVVAAVVGL